MKLFGWSMLGLLAVAAVVLAQGGPPPAQDNLDSVLRGWEKAMTDLQSFTVDLHRTALDKQLNIKFEYKGYAWFAKASGKVQAKGLLFLERAGNPAVREKYYCVDNIVYEDRPFMNKIRICQLPKSKVVGPQRDSFLSFLWSMSLQQTVERYDMEYKGGDKYYHYIRILPKEAADKGEFSETRLSLSRADHMPAQLWIRQPNGKEISWTFSKMQIDVPIPDDFFKP